MDTTNSTTESEVKCKQCTLSRPVTEIEQFSGYCKFCARIVQLENVLPDPVKFFALSEWIEKLGRQAHHLPKRADADFISRSEVGEKANAIRVLANNIRVVGGMAFHRRKRGEATDTSSLPLTKEEILKDYDGPTCPEEMRIRLIADGEEKMAGALLESFDKGEGKYVGPQEHVGEPREERDRRRPCDVCLIYPENVKCSYRTKPICPKGGDNENMD